MELRVKTPRMKYTIFVKAVKRFLGLNRSRPSAS